MSFRQKIKQVFNRTPSSSATREPEPEPEDSPTFAPPNKNNPSTTSFPTFSIKKTKTNNTAKTTKEAQRREKKERKEQKKRDKRKNSKPKIELYKPSEVPPSKYRGPRDEAHQQRLNAYTINPAGSTTRVARPSSPELSPTATRATPSRRGSDTSGKVGPWVIDPVEGDAVAGQPKYRPHLHQISSQEQGCYESESEPTTMVDTDGESANRSRLTLQMEKTVVEIDTIEDINKPAEASPSPTKPFLPEQLAEALNATRLRA